jgi:short-subunit dehydrogenase
MKKCIFITGAARGIGAALAEFYAKEEIELGILDVLETTQLEDVANRCRSRGAIVHVYRANVADSDALVLCARNFLGITGAIDLIIANAGVAIRDNEYYNSAIPRDNMQTNYFGVINTLAPFLDNMKERKAGHFVIISSSASFRATHNSGSYSASKAAINIWSEGLRLRLKPYRIDITVLNVGFVFTDMTKGNLFFMPGCIDINTATKVISRAINKKIRTQMLPLRQYFIWTFFRVIPDKIYDWIIDKLYSSPLINKKKKSEEVT